MEYLNTNAHIESLTSAQTLRELLEIVDRPVNRKLPTMKEMRSRTDRLFTLSTENYELVVYQCGFFTYSVGKRTTVQAIHHCLKPVEYKTVTDSKLSVPVEAFLDKPFWIRLALEGEARIDGNRESQEQKKSFRTDVFDMESADLKDPESDFATRKLAEIEAQDERQKLLRALSTLTERQRMAFEKYYLQKKTYQRIAEELGCSRQTAQETAARAREKLRKFLSNS